MALEYLHCKSEKRGRDRPDLLFVHGAFCGAWIWAETFLPYFCTQGHACHAVSLRGHGGSDGNLAWTSLSDYADDVEAAMDHVGRPVVLIGHSMGGLICQHVMGRGRVPAAAVLLASVPPSGLGSSAMHLGLYAQDLVWQLGLLQTLGPHAVAPQFVRRAFLSVGASATALAHLVTRLQSESPRATAEMMAPPQPTPPSGDDRPPILVLGGDQDAFLPVSAFRETATYFGADLRILQGAPHGLMVDSQWWQPVADEILSWLEAQDL